MGTPLYTMLMTQGLSPIVTLPDLGIFILITLVVLAICFAAVVFLIRVGLRAVPRRHLGEMLTQLAANGRAGLLIAAALFLTILFGVPSFLTAMYTGSSEVEKAYGMQILGWLLGGWGLGGGVSFVSLLAARGAAADGRRNGLARD